MQPIKTDETQTPDSQAISANSVIPISHQLVDILRSEIESGARLDNERIPAEREICQRFSVSRDTVRRAVGALVRSGHLRKIPRRGTFISSVWTRVTQAAHLRHRLWPTEEDCEIYGRAFDRFVQAHPQIAVDPIDSAMAETFDVVKLWGTTGNLYADRVLPLGERLAGNPVVRRMPDVALDGFGGRDNLLGVPLIYSGAMLHYNRARFEQAGLDVPDETWDWDRLHGTAKRLDEPGQGRFGFFPHAQLCALLPFIWQNGGELFDESNGECTADAPRVVEALAFFQSLIAAPLDTGVAESCHGPIEGLMSGRFAMCLWGGRVAAGTARLDAETKIGVAPPPWGRTRATSFFGEAIAVNAESQHPEQALALVEELTSPQTLRELAAGGNYLVPDPSLQTRSKTAAIFRDALAYTRVDLGPIDLELFRMLCVGLECIGKGEPAADAARRTAGNINALVQARQATVLEAAW